MASPRVRLEELERVLPMSLVRKLAIRHKVDKHNQIRLRGTVVFTCLLDAVTNFGVVTLRLLEEIHGQRIGTHADHSSFGDRLKKIPWKFFEAIYEDLHKRLAPQASAADHRTLRVRRVDATIVTLSAKLLEWGLKCGNRKEKAAQRQIKGVFTLEDDDLPRLLRVCEKQSETSDSVAIGDAMIQSARPNDLWVFDKGCNSRDRLLKLHQAGAYFLTPHSTQALQERETVWQSPDAAPTAQPGKDEPTFVVRHVEQAYFGNSQESAGKRAQWRQMPLLFVHGLRWDTRNGRWTPMVLMTNLPLREDRQGAGPYTWTELADVYRQRWEIEVVFKFLKQHLGYDHPTSRSENGIRVMIYMALIAALLLIWYKRQTNIKNGWRSVRAWFAHDLRYWAEEALRDVFVPPEECPC